MKNLLLILSLLAQFALSAQDVNFFTGTGEEANAKAKAENKMIMVDAYTYWCGPCKVMDKTYFHNNQEVADVINKYFVPYKIECEHDFGIVFSRKFKINGYPSLLYFNSEGQLVRRQMGYDNNQKTYIEGLYKIINMDQHDTYGYDATKLDMPWPDFYANDFRNAADSTWKRNKNVDPNAWLDQQPDLFAEMSWAVMARFSLNDKYNTYFLEHYDEYNKKYKLEADDKLTSVLYANVQKAAEQKNVDLMNVTVEQYKKFIPNDDIGLHYLLSYYYELSNDWQAYANHFEKRLNNPANNVNINEINNTAWLIYESTDDKALIEQVLLWFKPFLATMSGYNELDTYAALLTKVNRYKDAEPWAIKAIEAGKSASLDVKATEALLETIKKNL